MLLLTTVPTGAPQEFQRELAPGGEWVFTWQPPLALTQNGAIISYNFSCHPSPNGIVLQQGHAVVMANNISLIGFSLGENYTCSVAAHTAQGEGPVTSLQFSLSDLTAESVCVDPTKQPQIYPYVFGGASAILLAASIILLVFLAICLHLKKDNKKQ